MLIMDGVTNSTDTIEIESQRPGILYVMIPPGRSLLPITLEVTESGEWLATNPHILVHEIGDSPEESAVEFIEMALDQLEDYRTDQDRLSPAMIDELNYLMSHLTAPETT